MNSALPGVSSACRESTQLRVQERGPRLEALGHRHGVSLGQEEIREQCHEVDPPAPLGPLALRHAGPGREVVVVVRARGHEASQTRPPRRDWHPPGAVLARRIVDVPPGRLPPDGEDPPGPAYRAWPRWERRGGGREEPHETREPRQSLREREPERRVVAAEKLVAAVAGQGDGDVGPACLH